MRDPERIYSFCNQLATLWATHFPDLRFGQLVSIVFTKMQVEQRDPFFPEEDEMLNYFKKYLGVCEK